MNPLSGQAARAGGIGVAVFGVAFLGLQALQQAVGAFDPRTDVVVAIIIAVSAGTLTLDRLRTRTSEKAELGERQKALERAVLIWEPVPLKQVSPEGLGIFPTKPENGKQPKDDLDHASSDVEDWGGYVERDVDPGLRDALTMAPFVLVFGGPRSGKTRTVAQLARTVLGDALALVPRNAEGLEALLELRPQLHSEHVVLWLDSLERFAKVIDAKTLDSLAATRDPTSAGEESAYPGPPITVVATIREDTWDRLMKADGQDGEFAKAVAARARVFKVPAVLDPGREKAAAQRLYPRANLDQGIGAALAASGKEEELRATTPLRRSDPEPEASTQSPADAWLLLPAAACVLAALWVGASAAVNGGISKARQPTIGEQVAEIRSEGAKGSRVSDEPNPVDLHGSGQDSWVFSFRELTRSVADEIQIWDVVGGDKLEQRFTFQPNHPAVFQFRDPADLDGDALVVSSVTVPAHGTAAVNPDGTIAYAPAANFNGADSFSYTVGDGNGGTATATVSVTVTAANDGPVAVNDTATTAEDTAATIAVLTNDSDLDGDALTVTGVTVPAHGTATVNPDGTIAYAPAANYHGADSFSYTIGDGNGGSFPPDRARLDPATRSQSRPARCTKSPTSAPKSWLFCAAVRRVTSTTIRCSWIDGRSFSVMRPLRSLKLSQALSSARPNARSGQSLLRNRSIPR
jgi:CshA-type fibril repeat protein